MYDKSSPAQKIGLQYGYKLRYIGSIQGNLRSIQNATNHGFEVLTTDEIHEIELILDRAKGRAKEEVDRQKALLPPGGLGQ